MLLNRKKVKFWQKIIFGFMAVLMAGFLIFGYSGVLTSCQKSGGALSPTKALDQEIQQGLAAAQARPTDPTAWTALAENYQARGNQQPKDSSAQLTDWNNAAAAYKKAVKLYAAQKGKAAAAARVVTLQKLADVYLIQKDYAGGAKIYSELTSLRPDQADLFSTWGEFAINAGDTKTALLAFTRYLQLAPDAPDSGTVKQWIAQNTANASPLPASGRSGTPKPSPSATKGGK